MPGLLGDPCPVLTLPARSPLPSTVSSRLLEGAGDCTGCTSLEQGQGGGHAVRAEELRDAAGNLGAVNSSLQSPFVTFRSAGGRGKELTNGFPARQVCQIREETFRF